ncbi:MAG: hypothetical protein ACK4MV_20015 [Beijerinckiaceae bacterium]
MPSFRSLLLGLAAASVPAACALALECPQPQDVAKPGVIVEPETTIKDMAALLSGPDIVQRAGEIVAQTRRRYPNAQAGEIVNFLITAYCPIANARNVSEAEKQALVEAFAGAVTRQLY